MAKNGIRMRQQKKVVHGRKVATLAALMSVLVIAYIPIARWISQCQQIKMISQYERAEEQVDDSDRDRILQSARDYNMSLSQVGMVDPYDNQAGVWLQNRNEIIRYENELKAPGTNVMSWLNIPSIGLTIPVFHGTADETLKKGAGHLFGSSLPVGGLGTRPIITAHSGLPQATLFSNLPKIKIDDTIKVNTMEQDFYYRVTEIKTIEPTDVEGLGIIPGQDLLTLITCTPPGINTYRLVVTAERIPAHDNPDIDITGPRFPLFPWWVLLLLIVPVIINRSASPKTKGRHRAQRRLPQHRKRKQ